MINKILFYILRKILSIFQYLYLLFYALPKLYFHNLICFPFSISRGYCSYLLGAKNYFIKLGISSKSTIRKEYKIFSKLRDEYFALKDILPNYIFIKYFFISALRSEFLNKVSSAESLAFAIKVQKKFDSIKFSDHILHLNDCPEIIKGITQFDTHFGVKTSNKLKKIAINFLSSGKYHVGLIHGDFHSRNIMIDNSGLVKIVDLDCFRFKSIREFDALCFALEEEWSANKNLWHYTLIDCLRGKDEKINDLLKSFDIKWCNNLGIVFFLDRIGRDLVNYKFTYSKPVLKRFILAIEKIISV
jgi:serine/threonine protein kinase